MQEVTVRGNKTGLRVFVNGEPNFTTISNEDLTLLGTVLELVISKQYENYVKRKERDSPKKKKV